MRNGHGQTALALGDSRDLKSDKPGSIQGNQAQMEHGRYNEKKTLFHYDLDQRRDWEVLGQEDSCYDESCGF